MLSLCVGADQKECTDAQPTNDNAAKNLGICLRPSAKVLPDPG
jgi:hypothetical protein